MKINVWCIQISRWKRKITYKSELCFIFKLKLYLQEKIKLDIQHV